MSTMRMTAVFSDTSMSCVCFHPKRFFSFLCFIAAVSGCRGLASGVVFQFMGWVWRWILRAYDYCACPEHIASSTRALTLPPEWEQIAISRPLDCTKSPRGNQDCDGEEQSSAAVGSRETLVARASTLEQNRGGVDFLRTI